MKPRALSFFLSMVIGSFASAQTAKPPGTPRVRLLAKSQGREIVKIILSSGSYKTPDADCSHLVHDLYEQAGFSYDYASSRDLYFGVHGFARVRSPQSGDLVVWRGHVGIVTDPKRHIFFSAVSDGPGTQAYNSAYWRSRGAPRFYRYMLRSQPKSDSAALHSDD